MAEEKDMRTNHLIDYDYDMEAEMSRAVNGCIPMSILLLIIIGLVIYGFIKLIG
jgi:hypothetical protein